MKEKPKTFANSLKLNFSQSCEGRDKIRNKRRGNFKWKEWIIGVYSQYTRFKYQSYGVCLSLRN